MLPGGRMRGRVIPNSFLFAPVSAGAGRASLKSRHVVHQLSFELSLLSSLSYAFVRFVPVSGTPLFFHYRR